MINDLTLIVEKSYILRAWESIRITQSMNNVCGSIALKTSIYDPENPFAMSVFLGDKYKAIINGFQVGTGYIEEIPIGYNATSMGVEFKGRDVTCDLVDSSLTETHENIRVNLSNWIRSLIKPFGIELFIDQTAASELQLQFVKISAEIGENVMDVIIRACNQVGIMPISYGDSKLTLTKGPSKITTTVLAPEMVLEGRINQSNTDRHNKYIVIGQANGSDEVTKPEDFVVISDFYNDPIMNRYRPLVIIEDNATTKSICKRRAIFEANYRAGQSRSLEYTVEGWTKPTTQFIWKINELVMVQDPTFYVFRPMLISEIVFMYDNGSGFKTKLRLVHPSTYSANLDINQFTTISDQINKGKKL